MARNNTWTNSDGLEVGFGSIDTNNYQGSSIQTDGLVNELTFELDYANLPSAAGVVPSSKDMGLPANAVIQTATLVVKTPFASAGATTLNLGLKNAAGVSITTTGIDAAIAKTAIDAVGEVVQCNGTYVGGTTTVGAAGAYLASTVGTGPYTAGRGTLTIEYILPQA